MIWVTSFNKDLYSVSGHKLIETFLRTKTEGVLFVTYEGLSNDDVKEFPRSEQVEYYDLSNDLYLEDWLSKNLDVIPKEWGGTAMPCRCPKAGTNPRDKHKKGCHWSWFNRNCSRWFRKVVSLNAAIGRYDKAKDVIWIDCDCQFKLAVKISHIRDLYDRFDGFYLQGPRSFPECGIVGYNMARHGLQLFLAFKAMYDTREYKKLTDWSDCHVLQAASKPFAFRDIASRRHGLDGHVVQHSLLKDMIFHKKGEHGRIRRMFG